MDKRIIKNNLKLLVAYNIGDVITILRRSIVGETDIINEILLIFARYNDLNRDARLNKLNRDNVIAEISKIRFALMQLIDKTTESDISFDAVLRILFEEEMYQNILERKIEEIHFIGMLRSRRMKYETIIFNWRNYFISNDGYLKNINKLQAAINIIEMRYDTPLSNFENDNHETIIDKLNSFLLNMENQSLVQTTKPIIAKENTEEVIEKIIKAIEIEI